MLRFFELVASWYVAAMLGVKYFPHPTIRLRWNAYMLWSSGVLLRRSLPAVHVVNLGERTYGWTLAAQEMLFNAKAAEEQARRKAYAAELMAGGPNTNSASSPDAPSLIPDVILTVEHTPGVYTVGKRHMPGHFLGSSAAATGSDTSPLSAVPPATHMGLDVVKIRRGGGVTWHGPGQLTVYPIVSVKKWWEASLEDAAAKGSSPLRWYTAVLEEAIMQGVAELGASSSATGDMAAASQTAVTAIRERLAARLTGVWFEDRKVASIGLQVSDWVSMHGFAVNVTADPLWFDHIVMCELPGKHATNIAAIASSGAGGASARPPSIGASEQVIVASLLRRLGGSPMHSPSTDSHSPVMNASASLVRSGQLDVDVVVHDVHNLSDADVHNLLHSLVQFSGK